MKIKKLYPSLLLTICTFNILQAQVNNTQPVVKIGGEVTHPLTLNAADLAKVKRVTATLKDRDGKDHTYTGVPMVDLLNLAGATMGSQLRGENLSKYMLAKCADGYEVIFSLAEVDTVFSDRLLIIADELDGKPLPAGRGPF